MEKMSFYSVKKRTLLAWAGSVWLIAGFNVSKIGLTAYTQGKVFSPLIVLFTLVIFTVFGSLFYKMTLKHVRRIASYQEETRPFWNFFDLKSYLIMVLMMGGGLWLRSSDLFPLVFFAFFYTGLGIALAMAGVLFWFFYFRQSDEPA